MISPMTEKHTAHAFPINTIFETLQSREPKTRITKIDKPRWKEMQERDRSSKNKPLLWSEAAVQCFWIKNVQIRKPKAMILPLCLLLPFCPWARIIFITNVHDLALLGGECKDFCKLQGFRKTPDQNMQKKYQKIHISLKGTGIPDSCL